MAVKETIEEKLDRFIHVAWRDKALQNSHGVGKINIAGHAFHVPHRFQKLVIDTALKDSPQLFHFTADDIKIPALGLDLSQRRVLAPTEMYPLYWTPSKEGTFCVIRLNLS